MNATMKKRGRKPGSGKDKDAASVTLSVRISPEMRAKIQKMADKLDMTVNGVVVMTLGRYVTKVDTMARLDALEDSVGKIQSAISTTLRNYTGTPREADSDLPPIVDDVDGDDAGSSNEVAA